MPGEQIPWFRPDEVYRFTDGSRGIVLNALPEADETRRIEDRHTLESRWNMGHGALVGLGNELLIPTGGEVFTLRTRMARSLTRGAADTRPVLAACEENLQVVPGIWVIRIARRRALQEQGPRDGRITVHGQH